MYYRKKSNMLLDKIEKIYGIPKRKTIGSKRGQETYVKDGKIMDDILRYRTYYREVVGHLESIFYKFEIIE